MKTFELWPAVDLIDGKVVRLFQGDFNQKKSYEVDLETLLSTFNTFATGIHIVDLEGAKMGSPKNIEMLKKIKALTSLPIQFGGGIRNRISIETVLSSGADRVILSTQVAESPTILKEYLKIFDKTEIVVSVDVKDSKVMTRGWTQASDFSLNEFLSLIQELGITKTIITNINSDGTLGGVKESLYRKVKKIFPELYILAAGGVGSIADIERLQEIGIAGVVFGKAFYEKRITEKELNQFKNVS
ncbi:1-(5-phosphoribosyl)-5-[(5-phosphoribosylamino)methylideneamino]imidazole-4-carboxamide isomerase [Candidatus Gracilibacteria bacterium]|nr:1-(5-phosphoribosyl)-5-[(5-phosphoribosylamino)methylideneamino]imidazole-4-carboxamide isomerase [Candidatus Gracilibacteria bacterium]